MKDQKQLILLVLLVAVIGVATAASISAIPNPAKADSVHCTTERNDDKTSISRTCDTDKDNIKNLHNECKEGDNKCSGSQTGSGEFGPRKKDVV